MTVRIVGADELRSKVGFDDLIEPVSRAFQASSAGRARNGPVVMVPDDRAELGDVYVKTGTLHGHAVYVVKVSPWFAVNVERGHPQGGFLAVFDSHTGHTLAILDDEHYLSDIRTAAAGALAARVLAPARVETVTVLGSGTQAYWQTIALHRERRFATLVLWARAQASAGALAARLEVRLPGVAIELATDAELAVRRADVVITATSARDPLLRGDWLHDGQHVTAVGADDPSRCELDARALMRARVFVDSLETNAANGDVYRAIAQGTYRLADVAGELGDVLAGTRPGRLAERDITIAKLVGIGAQDLVAAERAIALL